MQSLIAVKKRLFTMEKNDPLKIPKYLPLMYTGVLMTEKFLQPEVCLFVLRFYGPGNPVGSCRARSVYLTTRLLDRLSPLSG